MKGKKRHLCVFLLVTFMFAIMLVTTVDAGDNEIQVTPIVDMSKFKPSNPLPDSELISIYFPAKWIIENSVSKDERVVYIEISKEEFDKLFTKEKGTFYYYFNDLNPDEQVALLKVPITMFNYFNSDSENVIINFPIESFKFYSDMDECVSSEKVESTIGNVEYSMFEDLTEKNTLKELNRGTSLNVTYLRIYPDAAHEDITYITGKIKPYSYSYDGEDYTAYHECELQFNNKVTIEIIAAYQDENGGSPVTIFPVVYDDDILYWPWDMEGAGCALQAPLYLLPREYEWYSSIGIGDDTGLYQIWTHDPYNSQWFYYYYQNQTTTDATKLDSAVGTSELNLDESQGNYHISAYTWPVTMEWVWTYFWGYDKPVDSFGNQPTPGTIPAGGAQYVGIGYNWNNDNFNILASVNAP